MFGWLSEARSCASRSNRAANAGSADRSGIEYFDRDGAAQPCVGGGIHLAHAAGADERLDAVRPEQRADRQLRQRVQGNRATGLRVSCEQRFDIGTQRRVAPAHLVEHGPALIDLAAPGRVEHRRHLPPALGRHARILVVAAAVRHALRDLLTRGRILAKSQRVQQFVNDQHFADRRPTGQAGKVCGTNMNNFAVGGGECRDAGIGAALHRGIAIDKPDTFDEVVRRGPPRRGERVEQRLTGGVGEVAENKQTCGPIEPTHGALNRARDKGSGDHVGQ